MRLGEVVEFRKDLYFEGAVQADWYYNKDKAGIVSENFVFHGKEYYGIDNSQSGKQRRIDTISFVKELSEKISDENSNPLTLAIADYGTGKSHLAVTLATLFSGEENNPKTFKKVIENISNIDIDSGKIIENLCIHRNFVLVINGMKDFNLNSEILRAAQRSLNLYGLDDSKLKKLNRALNTAELFFSRSNSTMLELYEEAAANVGWVEKGSNLVEKISNHLLTDDITFDIVNNVYKQINGQEIQWDEGISASNILEMLVSEYCGANGKFEHVVLLFDEFGRYLEYASNNNSAKSGESALQQIFETAQNSAGLLHIINFIQSDIKTYLQRVDPTSNITRYIGRYDASEKFYISSNLETVFANLIQRKNKEAFRESVTIWLEQNEQKWTDLFNNMNRWLNTKGMWKDYALFRKVVVEGIFPLHPISTFMLTQLSDYLQNRSSLTLTSHYISKYAETELGSFSMPVIYPEELMAGDLFTEMYDAESSGRQLTQQCLKYSGVLKKMDGKLNDQAMTVLRGNLVLRILKFKTNSYDDTLSALAVCTNLSIDEIKIQLKWLVDEYAVLEYDEQANCFDFMEDSNGAHDYKIYKNKILRTTKIDLTYLTTNQKIHEIGNFNELQPTDFAITNKISTIEWNFSQELLLIEDLTQDIALRRYSDWKNSISSIEPKGHLLWVYANKETDQKIFDKIINIIKVFKDAPIVVLLLKDSENKLFNLLREYKALVSFDYNAKINFDRFYKDDLTNIEDRIREQFDILKKERNVITAENGITQFKSRLAISLRSEFERIYPDVVPFWFDGYMTKSNNVAPSALKNYISILKLVLGNSLSKNVFNDQTPEIRTRIETLLMTSSRDTSWKCLNSAFQIVPPENSKVKKIFNQINEIIEKNQSYSCKSLFEVYTKPPYGLSIDVIYLLIAVVCANKNYCLRFTYGNETLSINSWKDRVFANNKIDLDFIKHSTIVYYDSNETNKKYIKLFEQIENNHDLQAIDIYEQRLNLIMKEGELPTELQSRFSYVLQILQMSRNSLDKWNEAIGKVHEKLAMAEEYKSMKNALNAMSDLQTLPIQEIFGLNNEKFVFSEEYQEEIKYLYEAGKKFVNDNYEGWIKRQTCLSIIDMNHFENKGRKYCESFKNLGLDKYVIPTRQYFENELANKEKIKSRQELKEDCEKFLKEAQISKYTSYTTLIEWTKKGVELENRLAKYSYALGEDAVSISDKVKYQTKIISDAKERITVEISSIWEDLEKLSKSQDIEVYVTRLWNILQKGLPKADKDELEELHNNMLSIRKDIWTLQRSDISRNELIESSKEIKKKYESIDYDFDALLIIENIINDQVERMDSQEETWNKSYGSIDNKSSGEILRWKDKTKTLPSFLSEKSIRNIEKLKIEVEEILSKNRIEEVLFYFDKLSIEEKKTCLQQLQKKI